MGPSILKKVRKPKFFLITPTVFSAGQKVAKHGNYGSSSISGASNVMETLGYKFKNDQDLLRQELEAANICFLHAPLFHPALITEI